MKIPPKFLHCLTAGSILLLGACASGPETIDGECQDVFGADVCSWGVINGDEVVEFGVTIPMASVDGAPADAPMQFPPALIAAVRLPEQVREATGFDHLGVNWEAMGHPPETWLTPHFDFHFYTVPRSDVQAIDCSDHDKPASTAEGYILPDMEEPGLGLLVGLCVPEMGMHAAREAELDDTETFEATMILGYYDESLIFLEPMISQAKLQQRADFTVDMPAVPDMGNARAWPTSFDAEYDAEAEAYRFVVRMGADE